MTLKQIGPVETRRDKLDAEHLPSQNESRYAASLSVDDKVEPIAIIGMSVRLPQDIHSTETFWNTLMTGKSTQSKVPSDRYNASAFPHLPQGGHFIEQSLKHYDAAFFSMTPSEAEALDPQQRWLLETTYEAIENAGLSLDAIAGTRTAVYVSSAYHDWENMIARDPTTSVKTKATAASSALLSNRLSWFYNLTGPSCSIDTACSGSLYALHQACQSLRLSESSMGIVCGCNLIIAPDATEALGSSGALSSDGIAYPFDGRANGYARGDAFATVIIKPLYHALRDGDTIRAVIRGLGVNQNGRTSSIGQPSAKAQEDLIRRTYADAGLDLCSTRFFEAHGTGTPIGDLAEAQGVATVFGNIRSYEDPLIFGVTKAVFGHSEAASGLIGLIKSVLVLERGIIPGVSYLQNPIPEVSSAKYSLKFPTDPISWPKPGLRRASISSFGYGGVNVHAIIDDAFHYLKARGLHGLHRTIESPDLTVESESSVLPQSIPCPLNGLEDNARYLFIWSAADANGLSRFSRAYLGYLRKKTKCSYSISLTDLAYTLSEKRSRLPWKSFAVATSVDELSQRLTEGLPEAIRSTNAHKLGFIFTGAQWLGMGQELMAYMEYASAIRSAEQVFQRLGSLWSLVDVLSGNDKSSRFSEPGLSQPVTTALQVALVNLLRSWNIHPTVIVGHSSGEIAAAYCSGALSFDSALQVAYHRGTVAATIKSSSKEEMGMMSVGLSESQTRQILTKYEWQNQLAIACINSNSNVTVSGKAAVLDALKQLLEVDDTFARILDVQVPYHSAYMLDASQPFENLIGTLEPGHFTVSSHALMISTVSGQLISPNDLCQTSYWLRNLTSPVLFYQAMSGAMLKKEDRDTVMSVEHWIELGPHSTLQGPLRQIMSQSVTSRSIGYSSVLQRGIEADVTALHLAGTLYCLGCPVDIQAVNDRATRKGHAPEQMLTDLPSYPFNYNKSHWFESRISRNYRLCQHPYNPYLGTRVLDWNPLHARWTNRVSVASHPWLRDHKLNGLIVLPGASMLVTVLEGALQLSTADRQPISYRFKDVSIKRPIILRSDEDEVETELCITPGTEISSTFLCWDQFQLFLHEDNADGTTTAICSGYVAIEFERAPLTEPKDGHIDSKKLTSLGLDVDGYMSACSTQVTEKVFYTNTERTGFAYGPSFAQLRKIHRDESTRATAELDLHGWRSSLGTNVEIAEPSVIHPAAFDAILQLSFACKTFLDPEDRQYGVPTRFPEVCIFSGGPQAPVCSSDGLVRIYSTVKRPGARKFHTEFTVIDKMTSALAIKGNFEVTKVDAVAESKTDPAMVEPATFRIDWKPDLDLMTPQQTIAYCRRHVRSPQIMEIEPAMKLYCHSKIAVHAEEILRGLQAQDLTQTGRLWSNWARGMFSRLEPKDIQHAHALALDPKRLYDLEKSMESSNAIGRLLVQSGRSLPGLLKGTIDALDVFFSDRSLVEETYVCGNSLSTSVGMAQVYLESFGFKNPAMRVLEVGGGSGSFTRLCLESLSTRTQGELTSVRFREYMFTDVSPSFFQSAKDLFGDFRDRLTLAPLDITKDPSSQGFEVHKYDLIIASSAIHTTPKVNKSLRHVWKLLRPGGKLLLVEFTEPDAMLQHFMFGLLDGWWLSTELHRSSGPLMSTEAWHSHLSDSGFSGAEIVFDEDDCRDDLAGWGKASVIISTKIEDDTPTKHMSGGACQNYARTYIIYDESCELQAELATLVRDQVSVNLSHAYVMPLTHIDKIDGAELANSMSVFLPEFEYPFIHTLSRKQYDYIQRFLSSVGAVLWIKGEHNDVFESAASAMIDGIRNSVSRERSAMKFATLSLQSQNERSQVAHDISLLVQRFNSIADGHLTDLEFRVIDGDLCIHRIIPTPGTDDAILGRSNPSEPVDLHFKSDHTRSLTLDFSAASSLEMLRFRDDDTGGTSLDDSQIEIEVETVGLNFKDVLTVLGQVDGLKIGQECAGRVSRISDGSTGSFEVGDRVCAIVPEGGAFSTFVRVDKRHAVRIPTTVNFAQAAALPVVFATAYYSLHYVARMRKGESILVHSGAGGLGQAVIQLARLIDPAVIIFATVSTEEKKRYLTEKYDIPDSHILSSRNPDFKDHIMYLTEGRGVDIVVNHLSGEGLRCSWSCIAPFGRFIEVGKKDILSHSVLPMEYFARGATFSAVDLSFLAVQAPDILSEVLHTVVNLLTSKAICMRPQVMGVSELVDALKLLQSGTSIGKLVIEMRKDDKVRVLPKKRVPCQFDTNATYVIAGGLGGLGRSTALWMAGKGARYLVLLSRRGIGVAPPKFVESMHALGVTVFAPPCDIGDRDVLTRVFSECASTMPPIRGCIHAAMDLQSANFVSMSYEVYQAVIKPKVQGSWNLHLALPPSLDFFIFLSSIMGIVGSPGQSQYAAANRFQDALAESLVQSGDRPESCAIDLGGIDGAGWSYESGWLEYGLRLGWRKMSEQQFHTLLDYCCSPRRPKTPSGAQVITGIHTSSFLEHQGIGVPAWHHLPPFSHIAHSHVSPLSATKPDTDTSYASRLQGVTDPIEIGSVFVDAIRDRLAKILSVDLVEIDPSKPIHKFGIDSLGAVELRSWMASELGCDVQTLEIMSERSIREFGASMVKRCKFVRVDA